MKNMTLEDKKLLFADICARVPYGVKVEYEEGCFKFDEAHQGIGALYPRDERGRVDYNGDFDIILSGAYYGEVLKPYLRHINDVTEDELADFAHIIYDDIVEIGHTNKGFINVKLSSNPFWCQINNRTLLESWKGLDFLNSIHVDYRGLLDKELAIRVTKHIDWYPMFVDYYEIYKKPEKKEPRKLAAPEDKPPVKTNLTTSAKLDVEKQFGEEY